MASLIRLVPGRNLRPGTEYSVAQQMSGACTNFSTGRGTLGGRSGPLRRYSVLHYLNKGTEEALLSKCGSDQPITSTVHVRCLRTRAAPIPNGPLLLLDRDDNNFHLQPKPVDNPFQPILANPESLPCSTDHLRSLENPPLLAAIRLRQPLLIQPI